MPRIWVFHNLFFLRSYKTKLLHVKDLVDPDDLEVDRKFTRVGTYSVTRWGCRREAKMGERVRPGAVIQDMTSPRSVIGPRGGAQRGGASAKGCRIGITRLSRA